MAVLHALGWDWERMGCPGGGLWKKPDASYHCGPLPVVTEVAESARDLVPVSFFLAAEQKRDGGWKIALFDHPLATERDYCDPVVTARAGTLPLALCSAALKLRLETPSSYSSSSSK